MTLNHPEIEDLDALISAARNYKAAIKKKLAHNHKGFDWQERTQTQIYNHNLKTGELNHLAEVAAYELHAACVNAGQSKPLGLSQYEPRDFHAGPMHKYAWRPAKPRVIANAEAEA